jgi:hypothetical protein
LPAAYIVRGISDGERTLKMVLTVAGAVSAVVLITYGAAVSHPKAAGPHTPDRAESCSANWKNCADNSDLANNYSHYFDAQYACKKAAENAAKYGNVEWPSYSYFGTFLKGDDYPKTGKVILIEKDAGLKNVFNATVRSRVTCQYDFNEKKAIVVDVSDRVPD